MQAHRSSCTVYWFVFLAADNIITLPALYKKGFGKGILNTHRIFGKARGISSRLMPLEQCLKPPSRTGLTRVMPCTDSRTSWMSSTVYNSKRRVPCSSCFHNSLPNQLNNGGVLRRNGLCGKNKLWGRDSIWDRQDP